MIIDRNRRWILLKHLRRHSYLYFGVLLLGACLIRGPDPALGVAGQESLSVSVSTDILSVRLIPNIFTKSENSYINISTSSPAGYSFSIASYDQTSMLSGRGDEISPISTSLSETEFSTNSAYTNLWGMKPSHYVSGSTTIQNNNYRPPPSTDGELVAITDTPNLTSDTYSVSFATKVNSDVPKGVYLYRYNLIVIANLVPYTITYDAHTSEQVYNMPDPNPETLTTPENPEAEYIDTTLSANTPVTNKKSFLGWCTEVPTSNQSTGIDTCSGSTYQPGDAYRINLLTADYNTTLYAMWEDIPSIDISYIYGDEISFEGKNYLDSGIALFSNENKSKDFKIESGISSLVFFTGQSQNINNVISDMSEAGNPYPGFAFRYTSSTNLEIAVNNNRSGPTPSAKFPLNVSHITILRKNQKLYHSSSGTEGIESIDYSNAPTFDTHLTFGAGMDGTNQPFRYTKGVLISPTLTMLHPRAESVTLTLPTPTLTDEIFDGWYSDANFTTKVGDGGDTVTFSTSTSLYAKWAEKSPEPESYYQAGEVTFDGTNHINTGIHLYSRANINRNYEISLDIVSYGSDNIEQATLMNSLNEFDRKYPGVLLRIVNANSEKTELMSTTNGINKKYTANSFTGNLKIVRIGTSIYYSLNGNALTWLSDMNPSLDWSNVPVTFGASVDENDAPFRNFKGTLANLSVKFLPDDTTVEDYDVPSKATVLAYSYPGAITFNGPCVPDETDDCTGEDADPGYINTGIRLFDAANYQKDFTISFEIDELAANNEHQAVIINALKEGASPWPGTLFRYDHPNANTNRWNFAFNKSTGSGAFSKYWGINEIQKFKIMRKDGSIFIKINNRAEERILSITDYSRLFDTPVTIGAGLDANGNPFRYFKGTISNIQILIEPDPEP